MSTREKVVVGIDGSDGSRAALEFAMDEAARRGAAVRVVWAIPETGYWAASYGMSPALVGELGADLEKIGRQMVDYVVAGRDGALTDVPVEVWAVPGPAAAVLVEQAAEADLLVVGHRGRGALRSVVLGSVGMQCVLHARGPGDGRAARRAGELRPAMTADGVRRPVVAGVDGSECALQAVRWAAAEAARRHLPLRLVAAHTWPAGGLVGDPGLGMCTQAGCPVVVVRGADVDPTAPRCEPVVVGVDGSPDLVVQKLVVRDRPARALVDESRGAQLVVVGSRGRGGLRGLLLGSVSQQLLHHAHCPVAVVRAG